MWELFVLLREYISEKASQTIECLFADAHPVDDFQNRGTSLSLAESEGDLLVRVA